MAELSTLHKKQVHDALWHRLLLCCITWLLSHHDAGFFDEHMINGILYDLLSVINML